MNNLIIKKILFITFSVLTLLFLGFLANLSAHPIDLNNISSVDIGWTYLKMGFTHIIPLGLDHILFILGIYLLSPNFKTVLIQTTVFTIAHMITLTLSAYDIISFQSSIIEPIISISIIFIALENLFSKEVKPWRIIIIFIFGLIHGMGFASVLNDIGLPKSEFITALITFAAGVELGQIAVILITYFLVGKWFASKSWYKTRIVTSFSIIIAVIALFWTVERIWN